MAGFRAPVPVVRTPLVPVGRAGIPRLRRAVSTRMLVAAPHVARVAAVTGITRAAWIVRPLTVVIGRALLERPARSVAARATRCERIVRRPRGSVRPLRSTRGTAIAVEGAVAVVALRSGAVRAAGAAGLALIGSACAVTPRFGLGPAGTLRALGVRAGQGGSRARRRAAHGGATRQVGAGGRLLQLQRGHRGPVVLRDNTRLEHARLQTGCAQPCGMAG